MVKVCVLCGRADVGTLSHVVLGCGLAVVLEDAAIAAKGGDGNG